MIRSKKEVAKESGDRHSGGEPLEMDFGSARKDTQDPHKIVQMEDMEDVICQVAGQTGD